LIDIAFKFIESLKVKGSYVAWAEVVSRALPGQGIPYMLVTRGENWEELDGNIRSLVKTRARELDLNPDPICIRLEPVSVLPAPLWVLPGPRSEKILDGLATALNPRGRPQMTTMGATIGIRWIGKVLAVTRPKGSLFPEEVAQILEWALREVRDEGLPGPGLDGPSKRDLIWGILAATEE
jgi:hypothetical protein